MRATIQKNPKWIVIRLSREVHRELTDLSVSKMDTFDSIIRRLIGLKPLEFIETKRKKKGT